MAIPYLNLARKWRSRNFDEIVGQKISVRILKNSLYLDQLFPVYLFSGQRGCGKTTTARVFAAAINCQKLSDFQKDPRSVLLPCLSCQSCTAMIAGNHPDFIEMDAASHTGVENVRTIVDAASLLPVMGRKKIYLIDEAHMLSKAAFNAFLKILEEPPASVLFILATTDIQKIIETVRSRCFQLFFTAIESSTLVKHLQHVCKVEDIEYEETALFAIVKESEGSARDALTLLEQVKFAYKVVTYQAVCSLLGRLDYNFLLAGLTAIVEKNKQSLFSWIAQLQEMHIDPLRLWQTLQEAVRSALILQCGVRIQSQFSENDLFLHLVKSNSSEYWVQLLSILHHYEIPLQKSTAQHSLLELMIFEMTFGKSPALNVRSENSVQNKYQPVVEPIVHTAQIGQRNNGMVVENNEQNNSVSVEADDRWVEFIKHVETLSDPLLISIFKQATFREFDEKSNVVIISFSKKSPFLTDWLLESKPLWNNVLEKIFSVSVVLEWKIIEETIQVSKHNEQPLKTDNIQNAISKKVVQKQDVKKNFDVSDKEQWATANALLEVFGGTLTEVQDEQ